MLLNLDASTAQSIATNFIALQHNNQARFQELRHYATTGLAVVFDRVPELLNINHPDEPGYVDDPATPFGVKLVERQLWRPLADRVANFGGKRAGTDSVSVIESLFLIGSAGSVGHNEASDLDYWVCYNPDSMTAREFELFQRKLGLLCDWAMVEQGTEANFYPINLELIAQGSITHLQKFSPDGYNTPHLLLEEFYRTFTFVAGCLPLWPVIPLESREKEYLDLCSLLTTGAGNEYVDLGYPKSPLPQEALATALNLAYNSEHGLFKGMIKITALLEYVEADFRCSPLCYDVKQAILTTDVRDMPTDPYIITVERVMDYGAKWLTSKQLELLRISVVLKILGAPACHFVPCPQDQASPKTKALLKWTKSWGWEPDRLEHLMNYHNWGERERFGLDEYVLSAITNIYARISQCILTYHQDQVDPHDGGLAHLSARLMMRSKGLPSTVKTLSYQQHSNLDFSEMVLRRVANEKLWVLHLANETSWSEDNLIYQHQRIAQMGAWLAHNNLYDQNTKLLVQSADDETKITVEFMGTFISKIQEIFPPIDFKHERAVEWSVGGHSLIMVVFNAEQSGNGDLLEVDFIFRTGWGEMRHHHLKLDQDDSLANKNLQIVRAILNVYPDAQPEHLIMFYFNGCAGSQLDKATRNIRGALAATRRSLLGTNTLDKRRLDL